LAFKNACRSRRPDLFSHFTVLGW